MTPDATKCTGVALARRNPGRSSRSFVWAARGRKIFDECSAMIWNSRCRLPQALFTQRWLQIIRTCFSAFDPKCAGQGGAGAHCQAGGGAQTSRSRAKADCRSQAQGRGRTQASGGTGRVEVEAGIRRRVDGIQHGHEVPQDSGREFLDGQSVLG